MTSPVETIAARVLGDHEDYGLYSDAGGATHYVCACDKEKRKGTHRAHVAAVLVEAGIGDVSIRTTWRVEFERAEEAEAENARLRDTLARVEALADEWGQGAERACLGADHSGCPDCIGAEFASDLRAALAGGDS